MMMTKIYIIKYTYRSNEEILVNHAHDAEICVHKNFIHNPHNIW